MLFLGVNVILHAAQAALGIVALGFNAPVWVKIFMGLYALTNSIVTLAQTSLTFRAIQFYFRGLYSRGKKNYHHNISTSEWKTMMAVTWVGQTAFVLLFAFYYK